MELVLIPGFWLNGDSWNDVASPLRAAGHTVHSLTLPGLESADAARSTIGLRDHVDAVVEFIDELGSPVVLVGHSGGGSIAYAVSDARPDAVSRVIYVDSGPLGHGGVINDELPVIDGEIPLPDWGIFEDEDLVDLTDDLREHFRSIAIPQPARVASDKQELSDERRYGVPSTIICCEFSSEQLRAWVDGGDPGVAEVGKLTNVEFVDLPTGHWPQLTKPLELADTILRAVDRR